jgi:RimJ/RimL family protein N-acetyltransferase
MFLRSMEVTLRALEENDALVLFEMATSSDAHLFTTPFWRPWRMTEFEDFVQPPATSSPATIRFGISVKRKRAEVLIGIIELNKVDWIHGNAEVGIIIWPSGERGKGYGRKAIKALSHWAFNTLRLRRLYGKMYASNTASQRCFEGAGFKHEGVWREHFFVDGKPVDAILYGLLREELAEEVR